MSKNTQNGKIEIGIALGVLFVALVSMKTAFIFSVIAFVALGVYRMRGGSKGGGELNKRETTVQGRTDWKQKALENILDVVKERGVITNNDVEKLLVVSDATAERYLDELEREGKLVQEGKTGRSVSYRLK
jgi:uncharacterized membrane protein